MIIGLDIDGCLADFNTSFINRVIQVTGKDLFPPRPFDIPTWDYPQHYGYREGEVSAVWENIKVDVNFWFGLSGYPDADDALEMISHRTADDIYFITSRPGKEAKEQTEMWLMDYGVDNPTVLISSQKGLCAAALRLDAYIDDRWENVVDVSQWGKLRTKTFLLDRPWNHVNTHDGNDMCANYGITRVTSVLDFLHAL